MGRALAEQVGRPFQSFAAGGNFGGAIAECVVVLAGEKGIAEPVKAETGGLGYAHHVPETGNGMTEGVEAAFGVFGGVGSGGEYHAGGADGGGDRPGLQDAHADSARALVARSGHDGRSCGQAGESSRFLADAGADFRRFIDGGQPALGNARGFGHFPGPAAVRHIEQQRTGGLLHVDGELAGEAVAHVILGAHDVPDPGEDLRLMRFDPQQLGQGEVGQSGIAGELDQPLIADFLVQPVAFRLGAGVAPNERWAQDRAVFVQHDSAVHLAGEANGRDRLPRFGRHTQRGTDGILRGAPPVFGILLGPPGVRSTERRVFAGGSANQFSGFIDDDGPGASGAHIHSQEPHGFTPRKSVF